ncbi:MAG: GNAT family N-acetyltransferase [Candidatus Stygibacter frigidus]|nr:GNAT family N-acetyltransferase [Candidatus Stygibacter frigidus]
MIRIIEIFDPELKETISRDILFDLPLWFGRPEDTEEYCIGVKDKTFFAAKEDDKFNGFISLHDHTEYTSEMYVVGVLNSYRNKGIGTLLLKSAVERLLENDKLYLTVKTLADTHKSKEYKETREFYLAKGFVPLEVFPDLWGADTPCLFMVKNLNK